MKTGFKPVYLVIVLALFSMIFLVQCQKKIEPYVYKNYSMPHIDFQHNPNLLKKDFEKRFNNIKKGFDKLDSIPKKERDIENTLMFLDELYSRLYFPDIIILAYTSPNKKLRELAQNCEMQVEQFTAVLPLRKPTYLALKDLKEKLGNNISGEDKRFLEEEMKDFERSGILLSDEKRKKLEEINQELSKLALEFSKNIREDKSMIVATEKELAGLPDSVMERLTKGTSGNYHLKMDYPTYFSVMENADLSNIRKRYTYAFHNRAYPDNMDIMKKSLKLKKEAANILGYDSIRDLILSDQMSESYKNVKKFLDTLIKKIDKKFNNNRDTLTQLNDNKQVHLWDIEYLMTKLKKEEYKVDPEEVRKYFPMDTTIKGCMEIYEKLLSIEFKEVKANAWHSDVKKFLVISESKPIAAVYLDLFPREDKYNHAAQFSLRKGRMLPNGIYESPVIALVCNFTKPTKTKPSLLDMDEVKTFFHEFGHGMHSCLTVAKYGSHSGTSVKRDFVEVPSQMFELWMNESEIINGFARHYETGKPMPESLLKKLVGLSYLQTARLTVKQAFYAMYDQAIHGSEIPEDTTALWKEMEEGIYKYPSHEGTHREASFGHLISGYSARYYSYLWSQVISDDMFIRFKKRGLLDPELGMEFRVKVLSKGNSIDPNEITRDFLGRKPSLKAFLKNIQ